MIGSRNAYYRMASLVEKIIMSAILVCHLSASNGQAMDNDRDGIDDGIEYALAKSFLPRIWYKDDALCTDPGVIAYHVSPYVPGGSNSMIEIAYTVLYYFDCGIGPSGHDFDDETFAITVKYDETAPGYHYGVRSIKTVAHMGTDCQKTEEDYYQDLVPSPGVTDGPQYVGDYWRSIYSSRRKHGNFLNEGSCRWYCDDSCDSLYVMNVDMNGIVPPDAGQLFYMVNVGEVNNRLVNDLEDIDNLFVGVDFAGEIGNRNLWSPGFIHHHYMASPGKPEWGDPDPYLDFQAISVFPNPGARCADRNISFSINDRSVVVVDDIWDVITNETLGSAVLGELAPGEYPDPLSRRVWDGLNSYNSCPGVGPQYMMKVSAIRSHHDLTYNLSFNIDYADYNDKPAAPGSLSLKIVAGGVELTWYDNAEDQGWFQHGETGFVIERSSDNWMRTSAFANIAFVDPNPGTGYVTYSDYDAPHNSELTYRVYAQNIAGYSAYSNEASIVNGPIIRPRYISENER